MGVDINTLITGAVGAALLSGIGVIHRDWIIRRRTIRETAAALSGDIQGLLAFVTPEAKEHWNTLLRAAEDPAYAFPVMYSVSPEYTLIFTKYIDRFGMLPDHLVTDLALFYSQLIGIRASVRNLFSGAMNPIPSGVKATITNIVKQANEWEPLGRRLIVNLDAVAYGTKTVGNILSAIIAISFCTSALVLYATFSYIYSYVSR